MILPLDCIDNTTTNLIQVLVVEDERIIARDIKDSLEYLGYAVPAIAGTSQEAIDYAVALRPHLILMDIVLADSDKDGIETAHVIRDRLGMPIPVIYLTAYASTTILERVKATNPFGYLLKPFREQDLWVAIETALKRHRLEQSLHEREEWLMRILTSMGDGVIVFDQAHQIKFLNPMAETLTGWTRAEALNQPIDQVFPIHHEETHASLLPSLLECVQKGEKFCLLLDALLMSRSGQEIPILDSAAPLRDQRSVTVGGIIVFRDARPLRLANESPEDFLSTISHELRTPLSTIKMATRMLTIVLDQFSPLVQSADFNSNSVAQYIKILEQATDQELDLVNDLLDIQQIQADTYPFDLSLIQLQIWLPHIVESYEIRAETNQQILQINLPADLPSLWTDTHILTRIVSELLNNACKYTPAGERITITAQVQPANASTPLEWIILDFCNSGVTIAEAEQQRIFEAFYRIPQSDRWQQGGTGLGLALVQKLIRLLGGRIEVSSPPNQVCFRLFLPLRDMADASPE